MAYGQSHRIEYKDYKGIDTKIEIHTLDYSGAVTDCEVAEDPLNIDIAPMSPNIFIPVIGTGASITLNSAIGGQFMDLFTINPIKRMVKIFKNNAGYPWWLGYINVEQYEEGYHLEKDYPVTVTCNDGFNALNRFKYLDENGNKYTSLETYWNILERILTRMGLPFNYLYFACRTTYEGISVSTDETLFHVLKADQNNYYDEQEQPFTYRKVLDSILSSFGLQIRWYDGALIIYEPQMLADEEITVKTFDEHLEYVGTDGATLNFNISDGDINWDNSDQKLGVTTGPSKQDIRYSPYAWDKPAEVFDIADPANWHGTPVWTLAETPDHQYELYYLTGITGVEGFSLGTYMKRLSGKKVLETDEPEIYIEGYYNGVGGKFFSNVIVDRWLAGVKGSSILFKGKIFFRTAQLERNPHVPTRAVKLIIKISVEVDGKRPHRANPASPWEWITSTTDFFYIEAYHETHGEVISDKWLDFEFQLPWNMPGGRLELTVYDDVKAYDSITSWITDTPLGGPGYLNIRFKDIDYQVIDVADQDDDGNIGYQVAEAARDDKKYSGKINEEFLQEGEEITLLHADAVNCSDRGGIRKADSSFTTLWKKTGDTNYYPLTYLLLRSIISQYQESLVRLSGTLEADSLMSASGPNFLFTIQDSNYLEGRKMMFTGGTYNDFYRTLNGTYDEIKQEDLTIVVEQ